MGTLISEGELPYFYQDMASINLFGKKWNFDSSTFRYIGFGLLAFYVIHIIKYMVHRTLARSNTNPSAPPTEVETSDTPAESKPEAKAAEANVAEALGDNVLDSSKDTEAICSDTE